MKTRPLFGICPLFGVSVKREFTVIEVCMKIINNYYIEVCMKIINNYNRSMHEANK